MILEDASWILAQHPVTLAQHMDKEFSGDWASWDPDTLVLQCKGLTDPIAKEKLLASHAVVQNSNFVCNFAIAFEKVVHAFCHNPVISDVVQPPTIPEITYTVKQLRELIRMVHLEEAVFSGEIPGYIASAARYGGIFFLPKPLKFAQPALNALTGLMKNSERSREFAEEIQKTEQLPEKFDNVEYDTDDLQFLDNLEDKVSPVQLNTIRTLVGSYMYDPTK